MTNIIELWEFEKMKRTATKTVTDLSTSCDSSGQHFMAGMQPVTGRVVSINAVGKILVQYKNRPVTEARIMSGSIRKELESNLRSSQQVLMVFEEGDPEKPIIIGLMEEPLYQMVELEKSSVANEENSPTEAEIDGERMVLEATKEIVLKCGNSSITLTKEGRIVIKGIDIVSRALSVNKVKGSCVELN